MDRPTGSASGVRFTDSWASVHFDLLRGIAAVVVLLEHWRNLYFVDYHQLSVHRGWLLVPYVLCSAGHQSVVFFFVLSGFFIGGSVFRAMDADCWNWGGYLVHRLVRLWTVLLPALLLCLFWDRLGIHLGHGPGLYAGRVPNHVVPDVSALLGPRIFFGNLFFVQAILTPVFGSDGALWSLSYEFWYYLLFPLGCVALWRRAGWRHRLGCGLLFLGIAWFVGWGIRAAFPVWLAGAALARVPPPPVSPAVGRALRVGASLIYFPIFFALGQMHTIPDSYSDSLLGVLTFLLLWLFLSDGERFVPRSRRVLAARELARFSYTLYAVHTPFLVFFTALLLGDSRWYPGAGTLPIALAALFGTLAYSYGVAWLTEFRTDRLRGWVERLFGMERTRAVLPSNPLAEGDGSRGIR